jgi:YggT family protein
MGAFSSTALLLDTASSLQQFVRVFVGIYVLLIFIWVLLSWIRIPYSRTFSAVQQFLDEVVSPYLRLFRGRIPMFGPIDFSPIVGVVVLLVAAGLVNYAIGALL